MVYHDPDDPEAGYFGEDQVIQTLSGDFIASEDGRHTLVEPAPCSICERPIPDDATLPLCRTCESTAKAHARLENDARRYPDPERRP